MDALKEELLALGHDGLEKIVAQKDVKEVALSDNKVVIHIVPLLEKLRLRKPLTEEEYAVARSLVDFAYSQLLIAGSRRLIEGRSLKRELKD